MNALSFDIEEWFCVTNFSPYIRREDWEKLESRVRCQTELILDILKKNKVKATFFILGWVAERHSDLVRRISEEGHEIASHGYNHKFLSHMGTDEFRQDLEKSIKILEGITDSKISGHRACSFTLAKDTFWVLDIMLDLNLEYDSSMYPVGNLKDFPPYPFVVRQKQQKRLIEFPLSTISFLGKNIRVLGGGPFRLTPFWISRNIIKNKNRKGYPAALVLHNWEFDPAQPKIKNADWLSKFKHYLNLDKTEKRIEALLCEFDFAPFKEVINKFLPK